MRTPLRLMVAVASMCTGLLAVGQLATVAGAADEAQPTAVIRSVDTTAYPDVEVVVQHNLPSNTGGNVNVNGTTVTDIRAAALADSGAKVGVVYVVDSGHDRIETFDLDGHYLAQWGSRGTGDGQFRFLDLEGGGNQGPEGDVALDAAGNLLVVDNWNHRVQRFAPSGTYLGQWGSPGSGPGLFLYPCGIAVAPDGTVVVTDNAQPHNEAGNVSRLMRFDASGAFLEEMRFPPIAGGPVQSLGVDIDSTGLVYVIQGDSVVVYDL